MTRRSRRGLGDGIDSPGWEPVNRRCFRPGPMPLVLLGMGGVFAFMGEVILFIKHRKCVHKRGEDACDGVEEGGPFLQFIFIMTFFGLVFAFIKQIKTNLNSRSMSTAYLQTGYYDEEGREEDVYVRDEL
ncbi:hypothetical protein TRICI_002278 [Trichomonascus ciferrii]|uniref:Uncharacterized protein n=1 Tax=Trichomonascus ciferrii TaxID=44093 RepID=A0A642V725_9ASCO|nr:hypothetical protein TRICI_002278 [Trichomonascus ciferrii]